MLSRGPAQLTESATEGVANTCVLLLHTVHIRLWWMASTVCLRTFGFACMPHTSMQQQYTPVSCCPALASLQVVVTLHW